jgi:D-psicose/D-tagatose/L-ribulose 3-epimerase
MKFAVTSYIWAAEFTREHFDVLPRLKAAGFDGLELPIFRPAGFPAAEIRRALEANGLEAIASCAFVDDFSLISDDADVRRRTLAHVDGIIKAAAELGAKMIAGPLYAPVGYLPGRRRTPDEWARAIDGYQTLAPALHAHDITLAIEPLNRFETYFLNTAADAAGLCDAVADSHVGVLFDTFHANIEEKNIAAGYRTVRRHLKHVHTSENDRGTPGHGHVNWPEVFQTLRELKYDDWCTIESFGFAIGDLSAAASIWRDLETSPESIALEGIKFLKGL